MLPVMAGPACMYARVHGMRARVHSMRARVHSMCAYMCACIVCTASYAYMYLQVLPVMAIVFGIPRDKLRLREAFIAMYDAQLQRDLSMHKDGTLLACTVALNSPSDGECASVPHHRGETSPVTSYTFTGGGTNFAAPTKLFTWGDRAWAQVRLAWFGMAWLDLTWLGLAWLGLAWHGLAWHGLAWLDLA